MLLRPLTTNEQAANGGMTHQAIITADDLTQATANTAQTIKLMDLLSGDIIGKVWWRVKTYFKNPADAAFNTSTMSVGDTATGVTKHIAATEVNANGTVVREALSSTAVGPYTAGDSITVTFNAMAAKSLSNLKVGEVHIFFQLIRPSLLEVASSGMDILTK